MDVRARYSLFLKGLSLRFRAWFGSEGRIHRPLVGAFVLLNGLVLLNAVLHDPTVGYDAHFHLRYAETLSEGRLPSPADTREFFCPPLPYLFPAVLLRWTSLDLWWAAKLAQVLNVFVSLGIALYVVRIGRLIDPRDAFLRFGSIVFLGLLPVYYRTLAFVRGEGFVALFTVMTAFYALAMFEHGQTGGRRAVLLGLALGMAALSRQWGILLYPAVFAFACLGIVRAGQRRWAMVRTLLICAAVAAMTGGWFYASLTWRFGSPTAFNLAPRERFALSNHPAHFYFGTGSDKLFRDPVVGAFPNRLMPIFYSDLWGDYWGYFVVYGRDRRDGRWLNGYHIAKVLVQDRAPHWLETNRHRVAPYLGRVNLASLLPSAFLLAAIVGAARRARKFCARSGPPAGSGAAGFVLLALLSSLAGYAWFLILYPNPGDGNTIKPTYMLHLFPLLALLGGQWLQRIHARSRVAGQMLLGLLGGVFIHNLPVMITRYAFW